MSTYGQNVCGLVFNCVSNPPYNFILKGKFFKSRKITSGWETARPAERWPGQNGNLSLLGRANVKTAGVDEHAVIPALGEAQINHCWAPRQSE